MQRVLAAAGVGARRACERMIEEGRVRVNGRVVKTLPAFVRPAADRIDVDGRPIRAKSKSRRIYIMLNKPERVLAAPSDGEEGGRTTVMDLVDHPSAGRLFSVGRLDYATAGLVLLTNDGAMANYLTHPRYGAAKTYRAVVKGILDAAGLEKARRALVKELRKADRREGRIVPAGAGPRLDMAIIGQDEGRSVVAITVRDGKSGGIGPMLAASGIHVRKLERTAIGPLELRGVGRGRWRELERDEVQALQRFSKEHSRRKRPGPSVDAGGEVNL